MTFANSLLHIVSDHKLVSKGRLQRLPSENFGMLYILIKRSRTNYIWVAAKCLFICLENYVNIIWKIKEVYKKTAEEIITKKGKS
jgi:hypothetical protein